MSRRSISLVSNEVDALRAVEGWPAEHVAVGLASARGSWPSTATPAREFRWASVTKPVTALACLVAAEEGTIDLDEAGRAARLDLPPSARARVRPAAARARARSPARASGGSTPTTASTSSAQALAEHAEMPFADYLRAAVLEPLGLGARYEGRPGSGIVRLARRPARARRASCSRRRWSRRRRSRRRPSVQFPGLVGVLPGFGRQEPNDWGLGFELRDAKSPHWTGSRNSPRTFGHFGRSGTFLWVDPDAGVALACLTDLEFGDWA